MRSRVRRVGGGTQSRAGGLTREVDVALHNPSSDSYNSISHLLGGASNSDGMQSHGADMGRDGNLHMGKVMDLAQTRTSTANDMASNSIRNGEDCSDAGLIHGGDGVDCLLGATCRHRCRAGVPVTTRRGGSRVARGGGGGCGCWGSGRQPCQEVGRECGVLGDWPTAVVPDVG